MLLFCVAQKKLEHEIKEREEKYSELDSKFNRLHKRAKQRIQEIQKVKCCYILFWLVNVFTLIMSIFL